MGRLAVGDSRAEREAMACFLDRVQREDSNDEVQDYVAAYLTYYDDASSNGQSIVGQNCISLILLVSMLLHCFASS